MAAIGKWAIRSQAPWIGTQTSLKRRSKAALSRASSCAMLASMPRKPSPPRDDPAESKRFIDMARELGADETDKGREAFERAFINVARAKQETEATAARNRDRVKR